MYYTLINYFDVWGNKIDGYEVNNQCIEAENLYIDTESTAKEIAEFLRSIGFLTTSDMRKIHIDDMGTCIEIFQKKDMVPLGCLMPE